MERYGDLIGYRNGYITGRLDALNGLRLVVALESRIPGYADGYRDGQAVVLSVVERVYGAAHAPGCENGRDCKACDELLLEEDNERSDDGTE